MARPKKQGLDYFQKNVDFYQDIKIRKLIRHKGIQAVSVYDILLCQIYRVGYYISWDDDLPFIISEISDLKEDNILDIINYALSIGLFDQTMYDEHQVLTSHGIQERFFDFCSVAKRKVSVDLPYLLVDLSGKIVSSEKQNIITEETIVFPEETTDTSEETGENSAKSTQSKVKESKEDIESSLHSDSPSSDEQTTNKKDEKEEINFLGFMDFFNRTMQEHKAVIATITDMTKKRREAVGARSRKYGKESLEKVVVLAATSAFLNGENDKSWVADFNWLFKPNNFVKVLEGNYNHNLPTNNSFNYGPVNNNGYRSREDINAGTLRTLARMSAAAEQPKRELHLLLMSARPL